VSHATARYDEIADFYDEFVGGDLGDSVSSTLLEFIGEIRGLHALDLACGSGRVSRELARRGASVVAADISQRLLDKARALEAAEPLGIEYIRRDVTSQQEFAVASFDLVVCHFGLTDIDDLDGTLATGSRVLRPGGAFVFSIVHPCFPGWGDNSPSSWPPGGGYYVEGWWLAQNPGLRGKVGANHRTLSTYLNSLVAHGFVLERVAEPAPDPAWLRSKPPGNARPVYLVARCRRVERTFLVRGRFRWSPGVG
jgi:SAM-dependent methyltransferase